MANCGGFMKSEVIVGIACCMSSLLLAACGGGGGSGGDDEPVPPESSSKYTVMVYMVGSDLESQGGAASADIAEMMQIGSGENLNVIVETGGANKDGWRTVKRHKINEGEGVELEDVGDLSMGESSTLQDFITWSVENFPADKYALLMWDHGGGAIGETFGSDENHGDALSLTEIKLALQSAHDITGQKFDVIGFDACLMATLETAYTLSPFASYFVASEELEPGHGWDYSTILSAIKSDPEINGGLLGRRIADGYKAHAQTLAPDSAPTITLSVTDLSKISSVVSALDNLVVSAQINIENLGQDAWVGIGAGRSKSEDYGNDRANRVFPDLTDLRSFASNISDQYPSDAGALITALDQAVIYKVSGSARPNASGLSIFLPYHNIGNPELGGLIQSYAEIDFSQNYKNFIGQFSSFGNEDQEPPGFSLENFSGNQYSTQVNGTDIDSVYGMVTTIDSGTGIVTVLGVDSLTDDVDSSGGVSLDWLYLKESWPTMNGHFVSMFPEYVGDEISMYSIPALLNGLYVNIFVTFDENSADFSIVGAWPGIQNGIAAREFFEVEEGDEIAPLFLSIDPVGNTSELMRGDTFTVDVGGPVIERASLPSGTYSLMFIARDYSQNEGYSLPVTVTQ
jgi:hypothetical protein